MTKVSYRNLSVLGLVLMGASAVTAAILPKSNAKVFSAGHIENASLSGTTPQVTCKDGYQDLQGIQRCDFTATGGDSTTSAGPGNAGSSDNVDANNTTGVQNTGLIATTPSAGVLGTWVSAIH